MNSNDLLLASILLTYRFRAPLLQALFDAICCRSSLAAQADRRGGSLSRRSRMETPETRLLVRGSPALVNPAFLSANPWPQSLRKYYP